MQHTTVSSFKHLVNKSGKLWCQTGIADNIKYKFIYKTILEISCLHKSAAFTQINTKCGFITGTK